MKKTEFMLKLSRKAHKIVFKVKQHAPEIMVVGGVIGTGVGVVMACKATTKLSVIMDTAKDEIDDIHTALENPESLNEEYTVEDSKKDLAIVYTRTGVEVVKLYAPAAAVLTLSVASMVGSTYILRKRNVALAAAYATVDKGFKEYRSRVIERFGKELDRELKYNIKAKQVEEVVINEDGSETIVTKTVNVADPNQYSDFARFFDDGCNGWEKDAEYNLMFLKHQQGLANDILRTEGYLFLNDVYDMLGIPRTKAGRVVGWRYDPEDPTIDSFVDFGIYDVDRPAARDFVNGYERTILLDFNVDGNILNDVKELL